MASFDVILEEIGHGYFPIFHVVLLCLSCINNGIQSMLNAFIEAKPDFWCHVPDLTNLSAPEQRLLTAPSGEYQENCQILDRNYTAVLGAYRNNASLSDNVTAIRDCRQWDYDHSVFGTTAVTEYDLVCSRSTFPAMAQSVYMCGVLLGSLVLGHLTDRYGRKTMLILSFPGIFIFAMLSALVPSFVAHVILRFVVGALGFALFSTAFTLAMELCTKERRIAPGLATQASFAIGYMAMSGVAYLIRHHVWINITMSAMSILFVVYWKIIPESPRWLMARGRTKEAAEILTKMAKINSVQLDIARLVDDCLTDEIKNDDTPIRQPTLIDLLRTPNMRKKCLILFYAWAVVSMVYYGLIMAVTAYELDPYLDMFVSGVSECLANIAVWLLVDRVGRKACMVVGMTVGGIACIICGLLPTDYAVLITVLSVIGKFGIAGAFGLIYVFTAELMPTVARVTGIGAGSMCARIGSLLAPFIGELSTVWKPLPTIIFGVCAVSAGLLNMLLPETLGQTLPETVEDGEKFGKNNKLCDCTWRKKREV